MSQLIPFSFESREVRVILDERGEPWVVAKDVAESLGYAWNGTAAIAHVPAEWRGVRSVLTPSGIQDMATLSEQGLYFFLGRSDKPKALPFQKWIAGEVVPSIRRTGGYARDAQRSFDFGGDPGASNGAPRTYVEALQLALQQTMRVSELQQQLLAREAPAHQPRQSRAHPRAAQAEHPWQGRVQAWLGEHPELVEADTVRILSGALGLHEPTNLQQRAVGRVMRALGWIRARRRKPGGLRWVFTRPGQGVWSSHGE